MKFIIKVLLIAVIGYVSANFAPFWVLAIVAFMVSSFLYTPSFASFMAGFTAIFLLWSLTAYGIDMNTNGVLTGRTAMIFGVSDVGLMLITGIVGGLLGGFASMTGSSLNQLLAKKKGRYEL